MNQLTLEWAEAGQFKTQAISDQQLSKNPATVRIGRDASLCDVVLSDFTVSPLHAEIFFDPQQQCFYLRNLRDTNPPIVNGLLVPQGQVMLDEGTTIQLGAVELRVRAIALGQPGYTPTNYATQTTPPPYQPTVQATQYTQPPQSQNPVQPTIPVSPSPWQSSPPTPPPTDLNSSANYPQARSNKLPLMLGVGVAALAAIGIGVSIASNSKTTQPISMDCSAVITGSIRSEPTSSRNNQLEVVGDKFTVTGKQTPRGWVELQLPNSSLGWSHRSVISNSTEMDSCLRTKGVSVQTAEDIALPPKPVEPVERPTSSPEDVALPPKQVEPVETPTSSPEDVALPPKQVEPVETPTSSPEDVALPPKQVEPVETPTSSTNQTQQAIKYSCQCVQDASNFADPSNAKAIGDPIISETTLQGQSCAVGRSGGFYQCSIEPI
jgi:hypothetical protein